MGLLLLVRHGQASFGTDDYDRLSTLGFEQARQLGVRLAGQLDASTRIVAGGLRRQQETARSLLEGAGLDPSAVRTDPRWNEYDADDLVARVLLPDSTADLTDRTTFQSVLDEALIRWTAGVHDADYAEPWPAFSGRVGAALDEVAAAPGVTVVVTSAGTIGAVCTRLLDAPPPTWALFTRVMANASLTKVVTGTSGTSLLTVNDHAHLEHDRALVTYR
ncbi:MAG: phosphoglycerate mutase [Frankiales bacterium]|nr:phosphoglycerate mutase [Frankiales bacterium]